MIWNPGLITSPNHFLSLFYLTLPLNCTNPANGRQAKQKIVILTPRTSFHLPQILLNTPVCACQPRPAPFANGNQPDVNSVTKRPALIKHKYRADAYYLIILHCENNVRQLE